MCTGKVKMHFSKKKKKKSVGCGENPKPGLDLVGEFLLKSSHSHLKINENGQNFKNLTPKH